MMSAFATFPVPGSISPLTGRTRAWRGWTASIGQIRPTCWASVRATGAREGRPGADREETDKIFSKEHHHWHHVNTMRLPESLWFEDYSSLSVAGDRIAVLSQASSALWVGRFSPSSWEIIDEGSIYRFPHDDRGKSVYCNVEGISWLAPDRVVVVSDRAKAVAQGKRCRDKDESIHIFTIPDLTRMMESHGEET